MDTRNKTALEIVHEVCKCYPVNSAIIEDGCRFTSYEDLWNKALSISSYIDSHSSSKHIGIILPKSAAYIETLLACWISGRAFVPIGKELPEARRKHIINEADIDLCVDDETYSLAVNSDPKNDIIYPKLDEEAYIIYSSGTTGKPKGIVVSHKGLGNLAQCQRAAFEVDKSSRYLFFLSTNFDASISDILVTLTSGAALVIETDTSIDLSARIMDVISERNVTHTDIPPSLLRLFEPSERPKTLKTIVIGGETAHIPTVRQWSSKVNLVNVYGPTEATVCTSLCRCTPDWEISTIGKVIDQIEYHIFNEGNLDASDGELWISGIGLAIGYLKNKSLTDRKFPVINNKRYYRTGDHVRRTESGDIEFLGRIDRQVKMHGQLVELEEIESVLQSLRPIKRAAVTKRPISNSNTNEILCAFIEPKDFDMPSVELEQLVRKHLRHSLPHWMIPACIKIVDKLPLTVTQKVDYPSLDRIELDIANVRNEVYQYANHEEEAVAQIMAEILKMPAVAPEDDFFSLGGDSLDCVVLIAQLQNRLSKSITMADLKQNPTPRHISKLQMEGNAMCMWSEDLKDDWMIESERSTINVQGRGENILLTGATGFLGSHLLKKLLTIYPTKKIYCLVRGENSFDAKQRIIETFQRFGLSTSHFERIEPVIGDLCNYHFGIEEERYTLLSQEIDTVFHCAATVNMLKSYDELRASNVIGTKQVVDFCLSGSFKHLHYASTLSVFVATDRNTGIALESDMLNVATNIYGGYGQTKYVAEKMLLNLPEALCKTTIYRFGLLCGNTQTGISASRDFLGMFFHGAKKIGSLPIDNTDSLAVDITPIDHAVDVLADIVSSGEPGIFHIASEKPLLYNHLSALMLKEQEIKELIPYSEWIEHAKEIQSDPDVQATIMSLCRLDKKMFNKMRYMDLFQTTCITFDMSHTHKHSEHRCDYTDKTIIQYFK